MIRVKSQIDATKIPQLIELCRVLHVDFRSGFGPLFQGVRRILPLSKDG
jgi:hypothetical protein